MSSGVPTQPHPSKFDWKRRRGSLWEKYFVSVMKVRGRGGGVFPTSDHCNPLASIEFSSKCICLG